MRVLIDADGCPVVNFTTKHAVIIGGNITIDGGMSKLMAYHGDCGWRLEL
ncbi:MAG: hypothetical protein FWG90_11600 [Oscillospiraceae bacterium]|nr:hypothetical protein [Oscillospiraceae bacterium]